MMASGGGPRLRDETLVLLVQVLPAEKHFMLVSLCTRLDVQLVGFDPHTGRMRHDSRQNVGVFNSDGEALHYLKHQGRVKILGKGKAALGYVVVGNSGLLLLAENARVSAVLPGKHKVRTVTNTKWHRIPCQSQTEDRFGLTQEELEERIKKIVDFPLNGAHWYSETVDVTRPFPSEQPITNPSWDFVWNRWLSESFRSIGLFEQCPALLQGTAELRELEDFKGSLFNLVLFSRRSRLNPGTRYVARGLSDDGEPGNEIECEQIIWRNGDPKGKSPVPWSSYAWRRGSVPIRWGVTIRNGGLGEAEIHIKSTNTFKGTRRYIRRLQKRYAPNMQLEASINKYATHENNPSVTSTAQGILTTDADKMSTSFNDCSKALNIVFVSLLRKGTPDRDRNEGKLSTAFDQALTLMRREHKLPATYFALDWHEMDKQLGSHEVIEALWCLMKNTVHSHGFALGQYIPESADKKAGVINESIRTSWYGRQCMQWSAQQKGVSRYNCADSLDRTNVASFFISVQVFVEQCRRLGLMVAAEGMGFSIGEKVQRTLKEKLWGAKRPPTGSTHHVSRSPSPELASLGLRQESPSRRSPRRASPMGRSPRNRSSTPPLEEEKLPEGWERRRDEVTGSLYYVDHVHKRTSWVIPQSLQLSRHSPRPRSPVPSECSESGNMSLHPFELLDSKVRDFREKVLPEALTTFAELFLMSGDRNAFFYTGSPAMHSDKIMIFEPESSPLRKSGAGSIGNWSIAISRRYNNVVRDNDRQAQIEMFLGIGMDRHFPVSHAGLVEKSSGPLLYRTSQVIPTDFPDTDDEMDPICLMNYPSKTIGGCTVPLPADTLPHSISNSDLREQPKQPDDSCLDVSQLRSLSESNLAAGGRMRELGRDLSFCHWDGELQRMDEKPSDGCHGLREVPVDSSPLPLG